MNTIEMQTETLSANITHMLKDSGRCVSVKEDDVLVINKSRNIDEIVECLVFGTFCEVRLYWHGECRVKGMGYHVQGQMVVEDGNITTRTIGINNVCNDVLHLLDGWQAIHEDDCPHGC